MPVVFSAGIRPIPQPPGPGNLLLFAQDEDEGALILRYEDARLTLADFYSDFVGTWGAPNDGIALSNHAWDLWNGATRAQSRRSDLTVEPGTYRVDSGSRFPAHGVDYLSLHMEGARFSGTMIFMGFNTQGDPHDFEIATTRAGDLSITLLTPSEHTNFYVGKRVLISAYDMMGAGFPQNPAFFEWNWITAINTGTGEMSLRNPLKYAYKSTYPRWVVSPRWLGGPASVFTLEEDTASAGVGSLTVNDGLWKIDTAYEPDEGVGWLMAGRRLEFNDLTIDSAEQAPTASEEVYFNRCTFNPHSPELTGQIEVDKAITYLEFNDCTFNVPLVLQSSCGAQMTVVDGCTFTVPMYGTGYETIIRNTTIASNLSPQPNGFGTTKHLYMENCVVSNIEQRFSHVPLSEFTYDGAGVLRRAKSMGAQGWMIPGGKWVFYSATGQSNYGFPFVINDVTDDGTDVLYHTTLPDPLPLVDGVTPPDIGPMKCQSVTVINCSGCPAMLEMSECAPARPMFERLNRTYNQSTFTVAGGIIAPNAVIYGRLVEIQINVTRAYTGVAPSMLLTFGANVEVLRLDTNVLTSYSPIIDLKTPGLRTITPSGVTGAVGADSISTPPDLWYTVGVPQQLNTSITAEAEPLTPIFTVVMTTDQD